MRLLFVYPYATRPLGGLKQIRHMVRMLMAAGCDAMLLRERCEFDDNYYYDCQVQEAGFVLKCGSGKVRPSDILVLPEYGLERYLVQLGEHYQRFALNNQNGYHFMRDRPHGCAADHKIEFAIANSETVARLTGTILGLDASLIFHVPHLVKTGAFDLPQPLGRTKALAVAYMPRKLSKLTESIRREVRRHRPDVAWVEIDGLPAAEVARRMSSCAMFLSTQHLEGCPLPSLEAMACGCVVAGFGGTPGFEHPYANAENGFWATDEDENDAVHKVLEAIDVVEHQPVRAERMRACGYETVNRFSASAVQEGLKPLVLHLAR